MFTTKVLTGTKEYAEAYLKTATIGDLLSLLKWNDRNSSYDDPNEEPLTLEQLKEAFWSNWEDQTELDKKPFPPFPKTKLQKALIQFNDAAQHLTSIWNDNAVTGEELTKAYPFAESFDEVAANIKIWAETNK
jgi:hypothetical protein